MVCFYLFLKTNSTGHTFKYLKKSNIEILEQRNDDLFILQVNRAYSVFFLFYISPQKHLQSHFVTIFSVFSQTSVWDFEGVFIFFLFFFFNECALSQVFSSSLSVQDIVFQLQRFVSGMSHYYDECYAVLKEADVFPIEVDLSRTMINYGSPSLSSYPGDEEDEEEGGSGKEQGSSQTENGAEKLVDDEWQSVFSFLFNINTITEQIFISFF